MKTTFPDYVMNEMADYIEEQLISENILYNRSDTIFNVTSKDIPVLQQMQLLANIHLMNKGVITDKMLEKEIEYINNHK